MVDVISNILRTKIYTSQRFELGAEARDAMGRKFRFIKYNDGDGDVDAVAGRLGVGLDSAFPAWEVTMDYDSSTVPAQANRQMGFFQAAFTNGTFGWMQTKGPNAESMLTDGGVTQGQLLMKHATTDGAVDSHTGDVPILAVALEADDASSLLTAGKADIIIE